MLGLFPEGFEEAERDGLLELAAYADESGAERARRAFGPVRASEVPVDWEERWKRFHRPVTVAGLWIGPPWERPPAGRPAVVIDPGRAFGTGAHPTTRLCIELLAERSGGSLLDAGCGSGVLAIAAARLGFAPVVALDRDEAAVEAARRNAAANVVTIDVRLVDLVSGALPAADTTVANLDERLVAELGRRIECARLVTSGYVAAHVPVLAGYRRLERRTVDGWAADLYARE
jgi:ribosomal protein L11 methyltransferase